MCSTRECGRYWVRTATSERPELAQLERTKSMMRYFPANGIAGFARFSARILRRLPSPPARIMVKTFTVPSEARSRTRTRQASEFEFDFEFAFDPPDPC